MLNQRFSSLIVKGIRFFQSTTPSWIIFNVDVFICVVSLLLAFLLRFNFDIPETYLTSFSVILFLVIGIRSIFFFFGRTHSMIVRHTGLRDLTKLILIVLAGSVTIGILDYFNYRFLTGQVLIPSSVVIMDFFITAYLITACRLVIKYIFLEFRNNSKTRSNVVIYGTDELAVATKRALDLDTEIKYRVLAFIDDKKQNHKKNIEGINIYALYKLEELLEKNEIDALILAKDYLSVLKKNQVVEKCLNFKIKVFTAPKIKSWINGDISVRQLKQINIEDLLERDPISLDTNNIFNQIENKIILVTGAAGSIGSEIVRQIANYDPKEIILLDQAETPLYNLELEVSEKLHFHNFEPIVGDIANLTRMTKIFERYPIDIIYHAAAYKHVPMMENNPTEALLNNVIGTKILADLAVKYNVGKFVMISTDKAVNPTNIMGATKRLAEMYIQSLNNVASTSFITTRFGNVLGSNGSAIPLFKKQIEQGGPVTVTHPEITRYFMTIPEACQLVLEASAMGKGGEIFIFDMGKSIKVVDVAKNMIRLSGFEVGKDIQIKYIGLRPGEKLYEELLCDKENTLPTYHPKIMIAKVVHHDFDTVSDHMNQFEKLIKTQNNLEIVKLMKRLIPEFKSQNSVYEVLDANPSSSSKSSGKISVN
jgi:FlaA1/EpsC-like NDP-sugar epimerase